MDDLIKRAQLILQVYYDRSLSALEFFNKDQVEEALKTLRLRNAAFANFRVVVYHAEKAQIDLTKCEPLLELYQKQVEIDAKLIPMVRAQKDRMESLVGRLGEARRKITGYHSGIKEEGTMKNVA